MTRPHPHDRPPCARGTGGAWIALAVMVAVVGALLMPTTAGAHASLAASDPADKAVLDAVPTAVELEFTGTIVAGEKAVQVFAPDASQAERGTPTVEGGTRVVQPIDAEAEGTYGVAYRVSSEDGHVITGTITFVVGDASEGGAAARASKHAATVDGGLQAAFSTTRFVEILALLVAAGGGIFASVIAPGWRPRLVLGAIAVLLVSYAVGFVLNTAIVRGSSVGEALSAEALGSTAGTPFALSLGIRAIVALVAVAPALLLRFGPPLAPPARAAVAIVFLGLAASLSVTGHAVTTEPTWLRMPLDMLHVAAAAVWLGGLVQLAFLAPFAGAHVESVVRFSRTAGASVAVLLVTGVYATYAELGMRPGELVDSRYGRLILGKLILYAGTMPLAWNNMGAFVPQLRRRPEDAPRMLRQYVWREFALVVVVIALTVWLIATPQPT